MVLWNKRQACEFLAHAVQRLEVDKAGAEQSEQAKRHMQVQTETQ